MKESCITYIRDFKTVVFETRGVREGCGKGPRELTESIH